MELTTKDEHLHAFKSVVFQAEMDEGFKCPPEAGGGYYGSRAPESTTKGESKAAEEEKGDGDGAGEDGSGVLPYRLRVSTACLSLSVCFFRVELASLACWFCGHGSCCGRLYLWPRQYRRFVLFTHVHSAHRRS